MTVRLWFGIDSALIWHRFGSNLALIRLWSELNRLWLGINSALICYWSSSNLALIRLWSALIRLRFGIELALIWHRFDFDLALIQLSDSNTSFLSFSFLIFFFLALFGTLILQYLLVVQDHCAFDRFVFVFFLVFYILVSSSHDCFFLHSLLCSALPCINGIVRPPLLHMWAGFPLKLAHDALFPHSCTMAIVAFAIKSINQF